MTSTSRLICNAFLMLILSQLTPAAAADATGTWLTENGRARVRTERCGSDLARLCGYVVWSDKILSDSGKPILDVYNPDFGKRSRTLLGHQLLLGLELNEKGRFAGKIYDGETGKSYDVTVWSEKPDAINVEGCMLAILCGKQSWKRVVDVLPGQLQGPTDAAGGPRADMEWTIRPKPPSTVGDASKTRPKVVPIMK